MVAAFARRPSDRDARRPWRSTRRGLLAAGSLALLGGCGKDEVAAPLPPPVDALTRQLAAERALRASLRGLPAPRDDRELVRRLALRSSDRTRRISSAAVAEGGDLYGVPPREDATRDPAVALERARAAVASHVDALPSLTGSRLRRLGTSLVVESAADLALLGSVFGSLPPEAFPGSRA